MFSFGNLVVDGLVVLLYSFLFVFMYFYLVTVMFRNTDPDVNSKRNNTGYSILVNFWAIFLIAVLMFPFSMFYRFRVWIWVLVSLGVVVVLYDEYWRDKTKRQPTPVSRGFLLCGNYICLNGRFVDFPADDDGSPPETPVAKPVNGDAAKEVNYNVSKV